MLSERKRSLPCDRILCLYGTSGLSPMRIYLKPCLTSATLTRLLLSVSGCAEEDLPLDRSVPFYGMQSVNLPFSGGLLARKRVERPNYL